MKMWRIIFILTLCLISIGKAWAVCPTFTPTTAANIGNVKTILENYNCYLDSNTDEYVLDFSNNIQNNAGYFEPNTKFPLTLNNTSGKLVKIIGLKLVHDPDKEAVSPYITFSGSKITLQDSSFTGPNAGTAIQIAASASATIGPTVSFADFTTGVYIAKDAAALVTQGKFTNVTTPIKHEEIPASAGMTGTGGEGVISSDWLGKHVSEADATKADRIAGKLDLTECKGSVEMDLKA